MRSLFSRRRALKTFGLGAGLTALGCWLRAAESGRRVLKDPSRPRPISPAQGAALRAVIEEAIARKTIPGAALAVVANGEVVFREGFGRAAFDAERSFTPEAPCFIASVTKPISATFLTMLDERGIVSLDDPVAKYLPEFKAPTVKGQGPARTTLRVWHLLSHRSGLPGNADLGDALPPWGDGNSSFEQVIRPWLADGLLAEPGARFAYGSSGYMVAARVAEVVMGRRYEELLEAELLAPLGMTQTTFYPDAATLDQLPARYVSTPAGTQRENRAMPLPSQGGLINPAGGLCSRLDDLAKFLALHLNGGRVGGRQLINPESLARMYRPHPPRATEAAEGGGIGYGLGWNVIAPGGVARHLGASGTLVWFDLRRQHAGVLLTQVKWGPSRAIIPRLMKEVQAIFPGA